MSVRKHTNVSQREREMFYGQSSGLKWPSALIRSTLDLCSCNFSPDHFNSTTINIRPDPLPQNTTGSLLMSFYVEMLHFVEVLCVSAHHLTLVSDLQSSKFFVTAMLIIVIIIVIFSLLNYVRGIIIIIIDNNNNNDDDYAYYYYYYYYYYFCIFIIHNYY